jgi:hypothetical protein
MSAYFSTDKRARKIATKMAIFHEQSQRAVFLNGFSSLQEKINACTVGKKVSTYFEKRSM